MEKVRLFGEKQVRSVWDEERDLWFFSIVDVVGVLTDSPDPSAYWRKLKQRLQAEGNQTVTNCHELRFYLLEFSPAGEFILAVCENCYYI